MITLISFGHKFGEPEADRTVDCRSLRNPHSDPKLRNLTGKDMPVRNYVVGDSRTAHVISRIMSVAKDGETIAFGCYGGRHRSVALAEMVGEALKNNGHSVTIHHRELKERRSL